MAMEMQSVCKNCNQVLSDNFCGKCGQSAKVSRVNFYYLIHEVQHSIFHFDKGILYTIKELLLRPSSTIEGYLEGKRMNLSKPFAFVILLGAIYGFIVHFFNFNPDKELIGNLQDSASAKYSLEAIDYAYRNYSMAVLALIPLSAFSLLVFFRRYKYNYWEYLVISSYIAGIQVFVSLVFYFLYAISQLEWMYSITFIISLVYSMWVLILLLGKSSKWKTGVKILLSILFTYVLVFLITVIITVVCVLGAHILKG